MATTDLSPLRSWQWYLDSTEQQVIYGICMTLNGLFVLSAIALLSGIEAPYGRYNQADHKASQNFLMRCLTSVDVPAKVAWVIQECPTLIWSAYCWFNAGRSLDSGNTLVLLCFVVHYTNRTIIFPLRSRGSKPIPLPIMSFALTFCTLNGYIQCQSLARYTAISLTAPTTIIGVGIWAFGLYLNMDADHILRNLRKPGEKEYKIPRGGLFEYVSGANFAAEILEWIGFAIATGFSLPGVTFAFCTACNIGPRAISHHQWYFEKFKEDYPKNRKALIPFVY